MAIRYKLTFSRAGQTTPPNTLAFNSEAERAAAEEVLRVVGHNINSIERTEVLALGNHDFTKVELDVLKTVLGAQGPTKDSGRVLAIRWVRKLSEVGLKEAKDFVDEIAPIAQYKARLDEQRARSPLFQDGKLMQVQQNPCTEIPLAAYQDAHEFQAVGDLDLPKGGAQIVNDELRRARLTIIDALVAHESNLPQPILSLQHIVEYGYRGLVFYSNAELIEHARRTGVTAQTKVAAAVALLTDGNQPD